MEFVCVFGCFSCSPFLEERMLVGIIVIDRFSWLFEIGDLEKNRYSDCESCEIGFGSNKVSENWRVPWPLRCLSSFSWTFVQSSPIVLMIRFVVLCCAVWKPAQQTNIPLCMGFKIEDPKNRKSDINKPNREMVHSTFLLSKNGVRFSHNGSFWNQCFDLVDLVLRDPNTHFVLAFVTFFHFSSFHCCSMIAFYEVMMPWFFARRSASMCS